MKQDGASLDTLVTTVKKKEIVETRKPTTVHSKADTLSSSAVVAKPPESTQQQQQYREASFYSNLLKIKLPVSFKRMEKSFIRRKYPTINPDIAKVYSNNDGTISILLERTQRPLKSDQLPNIKNQISQSFSGIPEIDLQVATIKKIKGKDFVVVEFESEAIDTRLYNLMFITDVGGQTFTGTFNCSLDYLTEWKPKAQEILNSVTVK